MFVRLLNLGCNSQALAPCQRSFLFVVFIAEIDYLAHFTGSCAVDIMVVLEKTVLASDPTGIAGLYTRNGTHMGLPIFYQHEGGVNYIYFQSGHWRIGLWMDWYIFSVGSLPCPETEGNHWIYSWNGLRQYAGQDAKVLPYTQYNFEN